MTGEELHRIIKRCRTANEQVYAVADAARDRAVAFRGGSSPPPDCRWLFEDGTDKHMTGVAPYVVPVEMADRYPFRGSDYLDLWAERIGNSVGILLLAPCDDQTIHEHLRSVFLATDDTDHKYFFRFYDPRVLRAFLPRCNRSDGVSLFGPATCILIEAETGKRLIACRPDRRGVSIEKITADEPASETTAGGRDS